MRVVLDTNVLISAFLLPEGVCGQAFDAARHSGDLLMSPETILELAEVLWRPKFDRYTSEDLRAEFLARLCEDAVILSVVDFVRACRDPRDDMFLSLAIAGEASWLVTGDHDLIVLNPFRSVAVVSPADFLRSAS
ncbi:MAG TPA: putative toxin-antitoxin system toxin component, PIN family [Acidimicrobiales bacterium]|nr:putative toxin-antitoxin system toxin component, PIN family [Acidimicrobiales bacterium]